MNVKFFLTIALSFGCVVMLFMWYSANGVLKESQLFEKQFKFKISTLESEKKMELKLINSLRNDIAKNDEELKVKTNLLESLHRNEKIREEERGRVQANIENAKSRFQMLNKEKSQWLENHNIESQKMAEDDKLQIQKLENELQLLKDEYKSLNQISAKSDEGARVQDALRKMNKKQPVVESEENVDGNKKKKSIDKEMQLKKPVINNDNVEKVNKSVPKPDVINPDLKTPKANSLPTEENTQDNGHNVLPNKQDVPVNSQGKDGHQLQGRPPVIKSNKSFKADEDGKWDQIPDKLRKSTNDDDVDKHDTGIKKSNFGDHPLLKNMNKDIDGGQLKSPKLDPTDNDENKNINPGGDSKEHVDKRNPKIIKRNDEHQVKPPVPFKKPDGNKPVPNANAIDSSDDEKKAFQNKAKDFE